MKKTLVLIAVLVWCLFLLGSFSFGQEFGSIKGVVKDANSDPLPGVTVSLTGSKIAPMIAITSGGGHFRFLSLPVAEDYVLKFELISFNTLVREKLVVTYGKDLNLTITMEMVPLTEEIVVTGKAPVIDTKKAHVGVNISEEMIMSLPTARNPWVIMSLIPGVLIDREDVGGNEGGQQSHYYGHGSDSDDSTWNIDGANITDNSALGSAPAYLNMSSYEAVQINYGNNDIKVQTGGVQINLVTRRGGNRYSGTFYLDVVRNAWQAGNVPQSLKDDGYTAAGINRLYLYGANFGGPLIRDKAWFYGSWGIQDIDKLTLAGTSDKTWLASGYARLDVQPTNSTRLNAFLSYDNKQKWNRSAWGATFQAPETFWNQGGPGYLWKGEVEQFFGNLYLNAKAIYTNGGFALTPVNGPPTADGSGDYMVMSDYPSFYVTGNIDYYGCDRDQINVNLSGIYFAENVLGGDHEFKFGADYVAATTTTFDYYEGNLALYYAGPDETMPTGEWWEAWLKRDALFNYYFTRYSAFIQDTMTLGKFAFNLGVRYDQEKSTIKDVSIPASPWLSQYMPAVSIQDLDPGVKWQVISPRISVAYDLFGNGKDVIKLAVARYGSQSGNNLAAHVDPLGWTEIYVLWQDLNGDSRVTSDELFGYDWDTGELKDPNDPDYWLGYTATVNPDDPTSVEAMNRFDPNYNSPLLDEVSLSYEKEILTDFAARLEFFYKKRHRQTWARSMMVDGSIETEDNYYVAGHNDTVDYDIYGRYEYFPYEYRTNHKRAYDRYLGTQIVLEKRLSNKWMMNASFTYSDWRRYYKGEYLGVVYDTIYNPSGTGIKYGLSNEEYFDGGVVATESGGSGESRLYPNARWMFKLSGLYQLPYGINISGFFSARDGYVNPTHILVQFPGIGSEELYGSPGGGGKYGDERLPAFWVLNLRLEKVFNISDASSVAVALDAFNITNSAHPTKRETRITADGFNQDRQILSPRVFRVGIRFNF
ncbi:MAG: carboxypeptidase regulatory-like domain-containing protein [Candidatus Aminicenantaceae bacterium]